MSEVVRAAGELGRRLIVTLVESGDDESHSTRRNVLDAAVLLLLGIGLVVSVWLVPHLGAFVVRPKLFARYEGVQFVFFVLASAWVLLRRPTLRWSLPVIILIALAARLVLVSGTPWASSDIYRYVWDGKVQAHLINPYRYAPQAEALKSLRDSSIYPLMNRRWVPTIYPPVAQFVFASLYLIHSNSIVWTRIAFSLSDVGVVGLIAALLKRTGSRPDRAILYAWHPLAIFEVGSSGHVDVLAVLLLLVALHARLSRRPILTGAGIAAAALVKYYALVAAPALLTGNWRRDLKFAAGVVGTTVLAYVPYLSVGKDVIGFLPGYVKEEGIASGGRFYVLDRLGEYAHKFGWHIPAFVSRHHGNAAHLYDVSLLIIMGLLAFWMWRRPIENPFDIPRRTLVLFLTLLVLTTPSYPWYALLALVLLPFAGRRMFIATFYSSATAILLYLQWWWPGQPHWPLKVVYGGGAIIFAAAVLSYAVSQVPWKRLVAVAPRRSTMQTGQEA